MTTTKYSDRPISLWQRMAWSYAVAKGYTPTRAFGPNLQHVCAKTSGAVRLGDWGGADLLPGADELPLTVRAARGAGPLVHFHVRKTVEGGLREQTLHVETCDYDWAKSKYGRADVE